MNGFENRIGGVPTTRLVSVVSQSSVRNGARHGRFQAIKRDKSPFQRRGGDLQLIRHGIQAGRKPGLSDTRPIAKPVKHRHRHQDGGRKVVSKLLDTIAPGLASFLRVFGRHRIPSEDMKKLMRRGQNDAGPQPHDD